MPRAVKKVRLTIRLDERTKQQLDELQGSRTDAIARAVQLLHAYETNALAGLMQVPTTSAVMSRRERREMQYDVENEV
jgi:hypothetical protein